MATTGRTGDVADDLARPVAPPMPLASAVVGLAIGIALSGALGPLAPPQHWALFVAPFAVAILLLVLRRRLDRPWLRAALLVALALPVGVARHQLTHVRPADHVTHGLAAEPILARVAGRIVTTPVEQPGVKYNPFSPFEPPARTQFVLALTELRAGPCPGPLCGNVRVNVEATGLNLAAGQLVQLTGKLYRPHGPRNPGELDWAAWFRRQNLDAGMLVEGAAHVVVLGGDAGGYARTVTFLRSRARGLLLEPYAGSADESARLIDVMVLGQRTAATRTLNEAFRRAGGLHFLAVSGFHIGVLAAFVWLATRFILRRGPRTTALATLVVTLLYALLAEPNAPILRAAAFIAAAMLALLLRRPICTTNWLALAAGLILLFNPHELFRAGFQFSFLQVLGLITFVPRLYRRTLRPWQDDQPPPEAGTWGAFVMLRLRQAAVGLVVVCVFAWALAIPLQLLHFGCLTPWGWLSTMVLTPLVALVIIASFITLVLGPLIPPLGAGLHALTGVLLGTVGLAEYLPAALVQVRPPGAWLVWATYGVVFGSVLLWRRPLATATRVPRPRPSWAWPGVWATATLLLALAWLHWLVVPPAGLRAGFALHVLAVGNGSAVILTTPDARHDTVYDVGTTANADAGETTATALRWLGVRRLETVLLSHANFDHYSGLPTLARTFRPADVLTNAYFPADPAVRDLTAQLPAKCLPFKVLRAGDALPCGTGEMVILWPPADLPADWGPNDRSLVVRVEVAGRRVLLTGDVERAALAALLAEERAGRLDLRAEVLVAPHHGAVVPDLTAEFLAAVSPDTVIVSSARVRPRFDALVREVLGPAASVLTTGETGAVCVRITPAGDLTTETPFAP